MPTMQFTKHIHADPKRTFEVISDFRTADQRIRAIKKIEVLTDGPIRVGTRFRETRVMFGREATEEMEITDLVPGKSYTLGGQSCGAAWSTTLRCVPNAGGTNVEMEMTMRPVSLFAKLMSPLSFILAGSMKKAIDQDLDDLKQALETARES